jgi:ABC-2 type transport system permease protein
MRKTLVVAAREYQAAVRTKTFLITLLIMPVMMSGSILVQWLLKDLRDIKPKKFVVVDRSGHHLGEVIKKAADEDYNKNQIYDSADSKKQVKPTFDVKIDAPAQDILQQRYELSERVRKGELVGFLEIGPNIYPTSYPKASPDKDEKRAVRYQSNNPLYNDFQLWVSDVINKDVLEKRAAKKYPAHPEFVGSTVGLMGSPLAEGPLLAASALFPGRTTLVPLTEIRAVLAPVPIESKGLTVKNEETGKFEDASEKSRAAPLVVPIVLMILMFMVIMVGATPLMQGVVEEKMQRIAEVLLGSVRPFQLMMGKLIGMVGVALTVVAVYLGGAYWAAFHFGFAEYIPVDLLIWFFIFQTLAAFMYGSLFIAIGAACTDMKETQTLLLPVMLLVCIPMFVLGNVIREPNSSFATGLSFFPFATPLLMITRQAIPPGIDWWQPVLGALLVLVTTILCVYAAGRIFRVGILMQGKGARLGDLVRWIVRG